MVEVIKSPRRDWFQFAFIRSQPDGSWDLDWRGLNDSGEPYMLSMFRNVVEDDEEDDELVGLSPDELYALAAKDSQWGATGPWFLILRLLRVIDRYEAGLPLSYETAYSKLTVYLDDQVV